MTEQSDRPYHHGDLRRAVIETALAMLHEEEGWQFTLREVARRAGVSHAAPYKHFPDKAALLAELALIGFDRLRETLLAALPASAASLRETFLPVARAYVAFGEANPALYRLMFGADAGKPSEVHLSERALSTFAILTDFLARGQEAGLIRERPVPGQAAACWAQLHGLTMLVIDGLLLPEKVGDDAVTAALTTLLEGIEA
ncbi:TetR/AcrR family transcriptional regulator [Hyphomicrobium sp.]|uniref:TetR/AcrR family transcriptional regulator n=1 Tax=Hyphomicrobium sp. TaxID=82 RepID=UPI0025C56339|nr:TetR/AcrR family transcriptional regulator [Hyphomicrobium sp.]MCC7253195.1 TetR/AcrR family transcriptional regulator [Hyphomicrobium sp.]